MGKKDVNLDVTISRHPDDGVLILVTLHAHHGEREFRGPLSTLEWRRFVTHDDVGPELAAVERAVPGTLAALHALLSYLRLSG